MPVASNQKPLKLFGIGNSPTARSSHRRSRDTFHTKKTSPAEVLQVPFTKVLHSLKVLRIFGRRREPWNNGCWEVAGDQKSSRAQGGPCPCLNADQFWEFYSLIDSKEPFRPNPLMSELCLNCLYFVPNMVIASKWVQAEKNQTSQTKCFPVTHQTIPVSPNWRLNLWDVLSTRISRRITRFTSTGSLNWWKETVIFSDATQSTLW